MESQPIGPTREKSRLESGYSEEEQAKVIEGSQVDTKSIKTRKSQPAANRHGKIKDAYQLTHAQILELVEELQNIVENLRHQEKILEEIRNLRALQEELIQCMLLEQKGELSETTASQDAWNLIK